VTLPLFLLGLAEVLQVLQLIIAWLEKKKKERNQVFIVFSCFPLVVLWTLKYELESKLEVCTETTVHQ